MSSAGCSTCHQGYVHPARHRTSPSIPSYTSRLASRAHFLIGQRLPSVPIISLLTVPSPRTGRTTAARPNPPNCAQLAPRMEFRYPVLLLPPRRRKSFPPVPLYTAVVSKAAQRQALLLPDVHQQAPLPITMSRVRPRRSVPLHAPRRAARLRLDVP